MGVFARYTACSSMKLLNLLLEDYVVVKVDGATALTQGIVNVLNLYGYVVFPVILIFLF